MVKEKIKTLWMEKDKFFKIELKKAKRDYDCQYSYLTQKMNDNDEIKEGEEYYSLQGYGSFYGHFQYKEEYKISKKHPFKVVLKYYKKRWNIK
jgi:hypothetical protein